jgi:hypothetical protein
LQKILKGPPLHSIHKYAQLHQDIRVIWKTQGMLLIVVPTASMAFHISSNALHGLAPQVGRSEFEQSLRPYNWTVSSYPTTLAVAV